MQLNSELVGNIKPSTALAAIKSIVPRLASLNLYRGEDFTLAMLKDLIRQYLGLFNVGKGMNEFMLEKVSELVLREYHYINLEEVKLVFEKALLGEYGEQYDRVDAAVILGWFRKYDVERTEIAQYNAQAQSDELKKEELWPEGSLEKIKEAFQRVPKRQQQTKRKKVSDELLINLKNDPLIMNMIKAEYKAMSDEVEEAIREKNSKLEKDVLEQIINVELSKLPKFEKYTKLKLLNYVKQKR